MRGSGQQNEDSAYQDQQGNHSQQAGFKRGRYHDDWDPYYDGPYPPSHKRQRTDGYIGPWNGEPISGRPRINDPPKEFGGLLGSGGLSQNEVVGISEPLQMNVTLRVEGRQDPPQYDGEQAMMQLCRGDRYQQPIDTDPKRDAR